MRFGAQEARRSVALLAKEAKSWACILVGGDTSGTGRGGFVTRRACHEWVFQRFGATWTANFQQSEQPQEYWQNANAPSAAGPSSAAAPAAAGRSAGPGAEVWRHWEDEDDSED